MFFINDMNILYVLNAVTISGGVAVVLKHVNMLLENGYNASVLSLNKDVDPSWFKGNKAIIYTLDDLQTLEKAGIDLVIATHFSTVEYVKRIKSERKAYFVQSDERRFDLPTSKLYLECTNSYSEDFEFITEAIWIQRWLKEEFGKNAYYIPNGLDLETFKPTKPIIPKNKKTRVLLEGSIAYGFKGMKDAYEVVKNLDVEIWIVSNNGKPYEDWKYDRFFESVNMYEMNKIYSSCDILVKMSKVEGFFGPPLEAMACGCAVVVGKVTGYDEYIVHEKNALVVEMGDVEKATEYVKKLQVDKDLFDNLVSNGRSTSEEWGWEVSEKYLLHFIEKREIAIKYKSDFPERYDFEIENKKITTRLLNLSSNCEQELRLTEQYCRELKLENESLRAQINNIERTKIWRIRRKILRLKDKLNKWKE
jgi:glycosyltransferase involved in cell wall biosynthesis